MDGGPFIRTQREEVFFLRQQRSEVRVLFVDLDGLVLWMRAMPRSRTVAVSTDKRDDFKFLQYGLKTVGNGVGHSRGVAIVQRRVVIPLHAVVWEKLTTVATRELFFDSPDSPTQLILLVLSPEHPCNPAFGCVNTALTHRAPRVPPRLSILSPPCRVTFGVLTRH